MEPDRRSRRNRQGDRLCSQPVLRGGARFHLAAAKAWTVGGLDSVEALNQSGVFNEVDPDKFLMHFAGVTEQLVRAIAKSDNEPFVDAPSGLWVTLGTED